MWRTYHYLGRRMTTDGVVLCHCCMIALHVIRYANRTATGDPSPTGVIAVWVRSPPVVRRETLPQRSRRYPPTRRGKCCSNTTPETATAKRGRTNGGVGYVPMLVWQYETEHNVTIRYSGGGYSVGTRWYSRYVDYGYMRSGYSGVGTRWVLIDTPQSTRTHTPHPYPFYIS